MTIIYTVITRNKKSILCEYTEYNGNFQQISLHLLNKLQDENVELSDDKQFIEKIEDGDNKNIISKFSVMYDLYKFYVINRFLKKESECLKKDLLHSKTMISGEDKDKKSKIEENGNKIKLNFNNDSFQVPLLHHQSEIISSTSNLDPPLISFMCLVDKENDNEQLIFNFLDNLISEFFHFYSEDIIKFSNAFSLKDFVIVLKKEMSKFNHKHGRNKILPNPNSKEGNLFKNELAGKKYLTFKILFFK
jgi:hypothetical protein